MDRQYCITDFGALAGEAILQTEKIQSALDACGKTGGTVVVPKGIFYTAGLYIHSGTTLYLQSGARLIGSARCEDYAVFPLPDDMELHTDLQLIPEWYQDRVNKDRYRRAVLSAYGEENIAVIGEPDAVIDGDDCADPNGEEGFRGPHGIFMTNCKNIRLQGYTICNAGNFAHQIDTCENLKMQKVTCLGGHDGVHLHFTGNFEIEDCIFHTGDDCIGGINAQNLTVKHCELNSACSAFRLSGNHILVEDCNIYGPGEYPHRMTVIQNAGTEAVRDKKNALPKEAGRHNMGRLWYHFGSTAIPMATPYHDIRLRRCTVREVRELFDYQAGSILQGGTYLGELHLEDTVVTGIKRLPVLRGTAECPLQIFMKNTEIIMEDGTKCDGINPASEYVRVIHR